MTDEENHFSAAFRRSFLRRRAHAAAQKRRSEIHLRRQLCLRKISSRSRCMRSPRVVLKGGGPKALYHYKKVLGLRAQYFRGRQQDLTIDRRKGATPCPLLHHSLAHLSYDEERCD